MREYVLGVDLGTSGVKASLVNLAALKLEYVTGRSYAGNEGQALDILWGKALEATREAVTFLGGRGKIAGIGLSGQMHGAVLFDSDGKPIGPLINWQDQKWSPEAIIERIKLVMGDRKFDELGTDISSGYTGAILFGIKENDRNLFKQIAHFVLPTDFLRGKFLGTNSYATDPTNAFGTGLFNTRLNCWHSELIQKLQLPLNIFPGVHPTSHKAGTISDQVADLVGLDKKVPIIHGGGDNQMSMLGSGLDAPDGPILINIGTAAQISKVIAQFDRYAGMDTRPFFNGNFAIVGASLGGGDSYQWLREQIKQSDGVDLEYAQMDKLAAKAPPGADGLYFCTGPTRNQTNRRRGFFGNTSRLNSISHRAKAVMEGVLMDLYEFHKSLRIVDQCDFIVGGGKSLQKNSAWSQIAADLFGKPVRITGFENAVFGAALMAAVGLGGLESLESSTRATGYAAEMIPDPIHTKYYRDEFVNDWRAVMRKM